MSAGLLVIGVLIGLCFLLILVSVLNVRTEEDQRLRSFAASLGGRYVSGGFFEDPSIQFKIQGRDASLRFFAGRNPSTNLEVWLPGYSEGLLRITPDTRGSAWLKFIGVREVEVEDRWFDSLYFVESQPESLARRVFAPERREDVIASVRRLGSMPDFALTVRDDQLTIHLGEIVRDVPVALALQKTASEFVGYLLGGPVETMEFQEVLTGRCPICTTALMEPLVRCRRCRAPHHRECWDYAGRCATYGCDPKPSRRAA